MISILSPIKNFLFQDVKNENESSKPAIVLRLASAGMMVYFLLMAAGTMASGSFGMLKFIVPCFILYGIVFALTYYEHVKDAAYGLNLFTIAWLILCLYNYGWDLGVQHFLFVLILINFFLPYWGLRFKLVYVAATCTLRIALFFYCNVHEPQIQIPVDICYYYQVVNTVSIFMIISGYGCLISSNFLEMEKKLIETNRKLRHQAGTDPLTQLMNRLCMVEYANEQILGNGNEKGISVAIGDIDHFKIFNDTYGHECGDAVLKTLAGLFQKVMQPYGAAARWGGEEFLFLFNESNGDEAYIILCSLRDEIKKLEVQYGTMRLKVTMTFGLVEIDRRRSFDDSIRAADQLLYQGKEGGRDRIVY